MQRKLIFTPEAQKQKKEIENKKSKQGLYSQVLKTLGYLESNSKHPSLKTHLYSSISGNNGEKIWEAYVQNRTPGAYRIFFYYGPDETLNGKRIPVITIFAIIPHP
ncbi:MAG: hypothetical protein C5B43_04370 [Verrucomicrobia bacterium]|nr:MAG: hypothetical protein C5B43_04370 [Verrucomicrobiota bacterium]